MNRLMLTSVGREVHVRELAAQQLPVLGELGALLDEGRIAHWLFGGWAVDFHVGRVTRSHSDVDLAVWARDAHAINQALRAAAWEHRPAADEDGGTGYERNGVRVELTYLVSGEDGEVFVALRDEPVLWSEHPLGNEVLELEGIRARVIPLQLLKHGKSRPREDPEDAATDRADFKALSSF